MRVLITGAAGMYGITLTRRLLAEYSHVEVIGVDDFSRDYHGSDPLTVEAEQSPRLTIQRGDFAALSTERLEDLRPDAVVHYAARISVPESMDYPSSYFSNNEDGTFRLAHAIAGMRRPPTLIYASSPEVYGAPVRVPMDESHPLQPRSVYAATKVACEMHCLAIYRWWGHPVVVIRNFNTFGPYQNLAGYPAVIPSFITRALRNEPLRVEGDGTQTRDFMYVDDAVDAYVRVLMAGPRLAGSVFNIGTGRQTSIYEVAEVVVSATNSKSAIEVSPGRRSDLPALCADTGRIEHELGWRAVTSLEAGIVRMAAWLSEAAV